MIMKNDKSDSRVDSCADNDFAVVLSSLKSRRLLAKIEMNPLSVKNDMDLAVDKCGGIYNSGKLCDRV